MICASFAAAQVPVNAQPPSSQQLRRQSAIDLIKQNNIRQDPQSINRQLKVPSSTLKSNLLAHHLLQNPERVPGCFDTTKRILWRDDTTYIFPYFNTKTRDGNILVPGGYDSFNGNYNSTPYLIKCTPTGNIIWSKSFLRPYLGSYNYFENVKELNNGDIIVVGKYSLPSITRQELAIMRLTSNGDTLWAKSFRSSAWRDTSYGTCDVTAIMEDAGGNIYMSGNQRATGGLTSHAFVLKMDGTGKMLWDKNFAVSFPLAFGVALVNNEVVLVGSEGAVYVPEFQQFTNKLWLGRLHQNTGDTLGTRVWYMNDTSSFLKSFTINSFASQLSNGNIVVY
jgi:hypothetical protein